MLGTSWECHKVREFALRPMGDFLLVLDRLLHYMFFLGFFFGGGGLWLQMTGTFFFCQQLRCGYSFIKLTTHSNFNDHSDYWRYQATSMGRGHC